MDGAQKSTAIWGLSTFLPLWNVKWNSSRLSCFHRPPFLPCTTHHQPRDELCFCFKLNARPTVPTIPCVSLLPLPPPPPPSHNYTPTPTPPPRPFHPRLPPSKNALVFYHRRYGRTWIRSVSLSKVVCMCCGPRPFFPPDQPRHFKPLAPSIKVQHKSLFHHIHRNSRSGSVFGCKCEDSRYRPFYIEYWCWSY